MLRRTKIIATLGPALDDEAILEKVILAGANVFRANFSHGEVADHERRINAVKKIERNMVYNWVFLPIFKAQKFAFLDLKTKK